MDVEHGLICSIVELGELQEVIDCHVKAEFFSDDRHRKVWDMLVEHWNQFGTVAEEGTIKRAYPNYKFMSPSEPIMYYIERVKDEDQFRKASAAIEAAVDDVTEGGPFPGARLVNGLRSMLDTVAVEHPVGKGSDWYGSAEAVFAHQEERQAHPGYLRGISTGFDTIDKVTGGFQPEQLITLVALPKTGKSSFALKCAYEASQQGYRTVFFTFEMSEEEQWDRLKSLQSGLSLTHVLNGSLTQPEMQHLQQSLKLHAGRLGHLTLVHDPTNMTTVTAINSHIKRLDPQLVVIDGVYMMVDESGERSLNWALMNIIQSLKKLAQSAKVPILCTTQALSSRVNTQRGVETASIGFSSVFGQSSDVVLGIDRRSETIRRFKVMDIRSGPRIDTHVSMDWSSGSIEEIDETVADLIVDTAKMQGTVAHGSITYP
jgi:replicative DNA helicase